MPFKIITPQITRGCSLFRWLAHSHILWSVLPLIKFAFFASSVPVIHSVLLFTTPKTYYLCTLVTVELILCDFGYFKCIDSFIEYGPSWKMFHVHLRKMCILLLLGKVIYSYQKCLLIVMLKPSIFLIIYLLCFTTYWEIDIEISIIKILDCLFNLQVLPNFV